MRYSFRPFASVLIAALLACACPARAEIIGFEPFTYSDGLIAGQSGGTFWDWQNIVPTNHTGTASDWNNVFGTPAVASSRLVTDNNSALREYNGPGEGLPPSDEANGAVNGDNVFKQVYYRVTLTTGPTVPDFVGMSSYDFGTEKIFFGKPFGQPNFGIAGDVNTNSAMPMEANTTYILVARLDYDDDLVRLYVNPDLSEAEPASATVSASYTDTFWSTAVRLASGEGGAVTWDDLVVATTWEDLSNVITGTLVTTATDEDNGSLGGGAGISLREAVNYSPNGTLITFDPMLSGETITLTSEIIFFRDVTIDATTLPGGLTVSGGDATRIFLVTSGPAVSLTGLTLTGGNGVGAFSSGNGGAIFAGFASTLNLTRCTLSGNTVAANGGALATVGTTTLSQCTLSNNAAAVQSGAIQNQGTLILTECTLANNQCGTLGGAILNFTSTLSLTNCTLANNQAGQYGGGVYVNNGTVTLTHCTLSGNSADLYGGGTLVSSGTLALTNCTLSGNSGDAGGGILINGGAAMLTHCTLVQNHSIGTTVGFDGGGAIDNVNGALTLTACILAGNTAVTGTGPDLWMENGTLTATNCIIGDGLNSTLANGVNGNQVGTTVSPINALLAPLGNYGGPTPTMPLLPGSPAIDAGGSTSLLTDQRGFARVVGSAVDIGAVEVQNLTQNVIYDSLGFESPRFTPGNLTGQDVANGPWLQAGTGVATVQNTNAAAGAQAVRVNRTAGSDVRFAAPKTIVNVSATQTPIIVVEWAMKYVAANLPPGSFGPLFGMEVYDGFGIGLSLAAGAFVDATTQELLYNQPGSGTLTAVPGIFVPPNTWHNYRLELDYATQAYRLIYDGQEVLAAAFVDPGITDFTDANIAAIAGAGDPTSQNASGTAYFDNYKITAQSVGSHILSLNESGANQATLSWTPTMPGSILLETPSLSPVNWTLSPSVFTNPVTIPTTGNKFYRLYRP